MSLRAWLLGMVVAATAQASDLGPDGRVHFAADALLTVGFEDAAALAPKLRQLSSPANVASWQYDPVSVAALSSHLVPGDLEGQQALHWRGADGLGLAIVDGATFGALTAQRVSVSFWGRAEGLEPYLAVTWGNDVDLPTDRAWAWARVPAIRTGRETSDGWVEYATGPIDGAVLDRPIHDLILSARLPTTADTSLLLDTLPLRATDAITVDAVEVRPVPGAPSTAACTSVDANATCGPAGECFYGRCVDAAVVWHPVPSLSMQQEVVERVVNWMRTSLGDRAAAARVDAAWVAKTLALASTDATPRTFWGGLNAQVVALRDTHTHFGAPSGGISTPFAVRPTAGSGPLDVCFGPTIDDWGQGQLAFVVWATGPAAPLQVGDVVTAIDGVDPLSWAQGQRARYAGSLPTVPSADWAPAARTLPDLLARHATTLTVRRCTGPGACTQVTPIDVPSLSLGTLTQGQYRASTMTCGPRFRSPVPGPRIDASGGDLVTSAALDGGTLAIEFDGFTPTSSTVWKAQVDQAFTLPHGKVLVDARLGHGGLNALGNYLFQQFRGTTDPVVLALASRGTFSAPDDPSLFSFDWTQCTSTTNPFPCATADIFVYQTSQAAPPAGQSKVAWLDTDDVSNNDLVPRLLKGRSGLQIFAPFPTYGALGSDVELPGLLPNWHSGTIAASDARFGLSVATAEATPACESGTGVAPDVVTTQTLSDVMTGTDSMLTAARNWLGP